MTSSTSGRSAHGAQHGLAEGPPVELAVDEERDEEGIDDGDARAFGRGEDAGADAAEDDPDEQETRQGGHEVDEHRRKAGERLARIAAPARDDIGRHHQREREQDPGKHARREQVGDRDVAARRDRIEDHVVAGRDEDAGDAAGHRRPRPGSRRRIRKLLAATREAVGEKHAFYAIFSSNYGLALGKAGRAADAVPVLENAIALLQAGFGDEHERTRSAKQRLAEVYTQLGRREDAARLGSPPS